MTIVVDYPTTLTSVSTSLPLVSECVNEVRGIIKDTDATAYRYSDADLVLYCNDALAAIAHRRPDLFSTIGDIPCVAGVFQTAPAGAFQIMDIFCVKGGRVCTMTEKKFLDRTNNGWMTAASGPTENWIDIPTDPVSFMVSPPAAAGQTLTGQWAKQPSTVVMTDVLPIPYANAVKNYMIFKAESRDDEHVTTQRAQAFLALFDQSIGVFQAKSESPASGEREE